MFVHGLLVAAGAFFGAIGRFAVGRWCAGRFASGFPAGTFLVNSLGSFLLGIIAGGNWGEALVLLAGTGFLGAFTTFSTFKLESVQLGKQKRWPLLVLYLGLSYTLGIALGFAGYAIGASVK
jgi:CrcB protein